MVPKFTGQDYDKTHLCVIQKVKPFVADEYDNENPYDNLSVHTTKESLEDTTSLKSGIQDPIPSAQASTVDLKNIEKFE